MHAHTHTHRPGSAPGTAVSVQSQGGLSPTQDATVHSQAFTTAPGGSKAGRLLPRKWHASRAARFPQIVRVTQ